MSLQPRKSLLPIALTAAFLLPLYLTHGKPEREQSLDEKRKRTVIETCLSAFEQYYVDPDAVGEMRAYIADQIEKGAYSGIPDLKALTKQLRHDLRDASGDRHIWVDVMANLRLKPGPPTPEQIAEKAKGNFGFTTFEKLDGNIGYLKLDQFQDPAYAGATAVKAMQLLEGSRAVILDLRENHGGEGKMVHLIASYFLPAKTPLNSLYFRAEDRLQEAWTLEKVEGKRMLEVPLFLLVSKQTTSAAESFAYTMKNYERATIVGENTRGAGHWVESYDYPKLGVFFEIPVARPINPVTKKGWENVGVEPDVRVDPGNALDEALRLIR